MKVNNSMLLFDYALKAEATLPDSDSQILC